MELPRRCILGWSPPGICTECGEGRRPVSEADAADTRSWALSQRQGRAWHGDGADPKRALGVPAADRSRRITGYACGCPDATAPVRPAVVVDPFGGTGTTALVASMSAGRGSASTCPPTTAAWPAGAPRTRRSALRRCRCRSRRRSRTGRGRCSTTWRRCEVTVFDRNADRNQKSGLERSGAARSAQSRRSGRRVQVSPPLPRTTDQKAGGSSPSERASLTSGNAAGSQNPPLSEGCVTATVTATRGGRHDRGSGSDGRTR